MTTYRATTAHGRVYVIDTAKMTWHTEPNSGYGGRIKVFAVGDRSTVTSMQDVWEWPRATRPQKGLSVFLSTSANNWRLSTEVVKVEEVP